MRHTTIVFAVLGLLLLPFVANPVAGQEPEGIRYHGLFRIRQDSAPEPDETIQIIEVPDEEFERVTDEARVRASNLLRMPTHVPEGLGEPGVFGVAQGDFFFHAGVGYSAFLLSLEVRIERILAIPLRSNETTGSSSAPQSWTIAGREALLVDRPLPGPLQAPILYVIDGDVTIFIDALGITVDDLVQIARSLLRPESFGEDVTLRPSLNPVTYSVGPLQWRKPWAALSPP